MEINGLSSAAMGGGRSANGVQQGMGQDEFLRLLMTQLQQQDPLNPMDNTEFVSQLSDFASLEQLQNMSTGMEHLAFSQAANTSAQMVSFIGKDVDVSSAEVMLGETGSAPIGLNLSTDAEELEVLVKDEEGRVVRTIEAGKTAFSIRHAHCPDGSTVKLPPQAASALVANVPLASWHGQAYFCHSRKTVEKVTILSSLVDTS